MKMKMIIAFLFLAFLAFFAFFAFFADSGEAQQKQNVNEESNLPQGRSGQTTLYQTITNTPGLMSYIGHLADAAGNPITASTNVAFSIYALATGGTALWSETHNIVPSSTGTFGVALGSITPISSKLFKDNSNLYLGVKVANDAEMSPRQVITSAAFAFSAEVASPREGYGAPVAIGTANASGTAISLARSDHVHQGVRSLSKSGSSPLYGDVTLSAGINTILTQTGQNLEVSVPSTVFARIGKAGSPTLTGDVVLSEGTNITLSQSGQTITIGSIALGSGNQVLGMNNAGSANEYKTVNAVSNETTVDHAANSITIGIADPLIVSKGGTGTSTQFTQGSVVFAGASGVYSQDNPNLFWDDTNNRLGIGTANPGSRLTIRYDAASVSNDGTNTLRLERGDAGYNPGDPGSQIVFAQRWWPGNSDIIRTGGIRGIKTAANTDFGGGLQLLYQSDNTNTDMLVGVTLNGNGNVIIGGTPFIGSTPSPVFAKLHVEGTGGSGKTGSYGFFKYGTAADTYGGDNDVTGALGAADSNVSNSIFGSGRITTGTEFNAFSDARIKNIQGVSDGAADLNTLRQIEIVDFRYKDRRKDDGLKKKVIGQQLAKVYPQAVHFMTAVVADIMRDATVNGGVITLPDHSLKAGERVKLIFEEGDVEAVYEVLAMTQDTFTVNVDKQGGVFVYGKEVADFHIVDYEAIAMLNVSATQELANKTQELANKLDRLEEQQKIIAAQQQQIESLQAEIKAIRESLTSASSASEVVGLR